MCVDRHIPTMTFIFYTLPPMHTQALLFSLQTNALAPTPTAVASDAYPRLSPMTRVLALDDILAPSPLTRNPHWHTTSTLSRIHTDSARVAVRGCQSRR